LSLALSTREGALPVETGWRLGSGFNLLDAAEVDGAAGTDGGEPGVVRYAGGVRVCLCRSQGVLIAVASGGSAGTA
jgi:hypothetical protein